MFDIIIVGGGPAGLTAALYSERAGKSVLVIEKETLGGQITMSPSVENYPAVPSVSGLELADKISAQVMELGAEIEFDTVLSVERTQSGFRVLCEFGEYESKAIIIAAGAKARKIGLPREAELTGLGVSYCAVCDGAFFTGRDVAVFGGGSSALQEALFLSEICRKVYIIHRRDEFRGEKSLSDALMAKKNVEFVMKSVVTALHGENELTAITVTDTDGRERKIDLSGLFVAIGHAPQLSFAENLIKTDESGYGDTDESCVCGDGVFIAGDCRRKSVRQLTTAVADGATSAIAACGYIDQIHH